jgi:hypothetical protein
VNVLELAFRVKVTTWVPPEAAANDADSITAPSTL